MSRLVIPKLYVRPKSEVEIARKANSLLIRGHCVGILPTPVEQLYEIAKVKEVELDRSEAASIWNRFSERARQLVMGVINQVRGAADLKKRVVFVPQDDTKPRLLFARAHELGHQVLDWHYVNPDYLDSDQTLSPYWKDQFEVEANLFAAETIFQGQRFQDMARQYRAEFASIFELANRHGTSRLATFWRFVEVHDEAVAGISYFPARKGSTPEAIQAGFTLHKVLCSGTFGLRYGAVTFDGRLNFQHEWAQARFTAREPVAGEMPIKVNGRPASFLWESYWNGYSVMVLLRRRPALLSVERLFRFKNSRPATTTGCEPRTGA
jgi:Zn-dependent peptidase ImmA (M78 family)